MFGSGRKRTGEKWEKRARKWLSARGMRILATNVNTPFGEIDVVCKELDVLVFVEVRFRGEGAWVEALESVDVGKRRKILQSAEHYLQYTQEDYEEVRFDIFAIDDGEITYYADAFDNADV